MHTITTAVTAAALILMAGWGSPAAAQPDVSDHCTWQEVHAFGEVGPVGYKVSSSQGGPLVGLGKAAIECQQRFYDDPELRHVWCERDWFLLGIFIFDTVPWDTGTIEDVTTVHDALRLGPAGGDLDYVSLVVEAVRRYVLVEWDWFAVYSHRYRIMQLPPGEYQWVWEVTAPWMEAAPEVWGSGSLEIVSHADHVALEAAGTWPW